MKRIQIIVWILAGVGSSLVMGEEPKKITTRRYDLSAVVNPARNHPFVLRPQGNLIFRARGDYESGRWDGIPSFGSDPEIARGTGVALDVGLPAIFNEKLLAREGIGEQISLLLGSEGLDSEERNTSWSGSVLQVTAPPAAQEIVASFLSPLEEAGSILIAVECLLVPVEVLEKLSPDWRSSGPYLAEDVYKKALRDGRSRLLSTVARSGQVVASGSKEVVPLVVDQEVNQTGVIPVVNPVVESPLSGDRIEVCPTLLDGQDAVWLDLGIGRFRVTSRKYNPGRDFGDLELPITDEALISTTAVAVPDKAFVAGILEGREGSGLAAIVRVKVKKPAGPASPAGAEASRITRVFSVSHLVTDYPRRAWQPEPAGPSPTAPPGHGGVGFTFDGGTVEPVARSELLLQALQGEMAQFREEEYSTSLIGRGNLLFSGTPRAAEAIQRILENLSKPLCQAVAVDVDLLSVPRSVLGQVLAAAEDGTVLADGWEKTIEAKEGLKKRRFTAMGVPGQPLALLVAKIKTFVTDVELVSGGTGFAIIQVADLVPKTCGDGTDLRLRVELAEGAGQARLKLEGGDVRLLEERAVTATFPDLPVYSGGGGGAEGGSSQGPSPPPVRPSSQGSNDKIIKQVQFTLPRQSVQYWTSEINVPLDREVILQTDAAEGEAATILVGRVRRVPR
jgi:hypothetical protein